MRLSRRSTDAKPFTISIWPAYTDLMTNFALVVFFIMMLSFVKNIIAAHELKQIVGIRSDVMAELKNELLQEIASGSISIDEKNQIIELKDSVLFDFDEDYIREEAKPILEKLANRLALEINKPLFRENVQMIAVEGHTDNKGEPKHNWGLSARRATNVVLYMTSVVPELQNKENSRMFGAVGLSQFRPKVSNDTLEGQQMNRRIEIRIYLKEEKLMAN